MGVALSQYIFIYYNKLEVIVCWPLFYFFFLIQFLSRKFHLGDDIQHRLHLIRAIYILWSDNLASYILEAQTETQTGVRETRLKFQLCSAVVMWPWGFSLLALFSHLRNVDQGPILDGCVTIKWKCMLTTWHKENDQNVLVSSPPPRNTCKLGNTLPYSHIFCKPSLRWLMLEIKN